MVVEVVMGAILGTAFVIAARLLGVETRIYALGLVGAAVIYAAFALVGAAEPRWMVVELTGIVPFAGLAWLGLRYGTWWLAAGWITHAVWDFGLHWLAGTPAFVPAWYPAVCLGFDFLVAGAIVLHLRARALSAVAG